MTDRGGRLSADRLRLADHGPWVRRRAFTPGSCCSIVNAGIALALGEGAYCRKGNQPARFQEVLASAGETRTALRVALAWGYMSEAQTENAFVLLDRVIGMCWRLTHCGRPRKADGRVDEEVDGQ